MCYNDYGDNMKEDVIDLFEEERNKRELDEEKKMAKKALKEKKREKRKEKKLEHKEDKEFAKMVEEKKQEATKEIDTESLSKLKTRRERNENIEVANEKHPFLNFFLTISIIILLVCSVTYVLFNVIKEKELENILTSSALCGMVVFYILSIIIKNIRAKKFFEILATLSIAGYMGYFLFIA